MSPRSDAWGRWSVHPEHSEGPVRQSWWRHCRSGSCEKWFRCGAELGQVGECPGIDKFGESAPAEVLYEHFHLTVDGVEDVVRKVLAERAGSVGEYDGP